MDQINDFLFYVHALPVPQDHGSQPKNNLQWEDISLVCKIATPCSSIHSSNTKLMDCPPDHFSDDLVLIIL